MQEKAYETGIPQKLGEHANTARDAAAAKYDDLTTQVREASLPASSCECFLVQFPGMMLRLPSMTI